MGVALRCGDGGVPEHPLIFRRSAPFWDILLVLVTLSMIMLPQLGNFNWLARYVVVKEDVAALCAPLKKFLDGGWCAWPVRCAWRHGAGAQHPDRLAGERGPLDWR